MSRPIVSVKYAIELVVALILFSTAAGTIRADQDGLVTKNVADVALFSWTPSPWNNVGGETGTSKDVPKGSAGAASLEITVNYTGGGFGHFSAVPSQAAIPGRCKKVSATVKSEQAGYTWMVTFKDANSKSEVGGKKLEWALKIDPGKWVAQEFAIPADWAQPISIEAIAAHNWDNQSKKADAVLRVADLTVQTDISAIKNRDSLVTVTCATGALANVFVAGEQVVHQVKCDSWQGKELKGKLSYTIFENAAMKPAVQDSRDLAFTAGCVLPVTFTPERFGVYELSATVALDGGLSLTKKVRFAYVPKPPAYTSQEKLASPWGMNIHGGAGDVPYRAYGRIGFVWLRDYAWGREWMARARGVDGQYGGWPYYRKMDAGLKDSGLMLLACMQGSMRDEVKAGRLAPDKAWKGDMLAFMLAFDQPAWELDNEYDYGTGRDDMKRGGDAYHAFHKAFGQLVKFADDKCLAVEQGTAGIHPDWVRRAIAKGAFDNIDAVNAHFYCGVKPPEVSTENANVGGQDSPALLWDTLREFVEAARSDGKPRQAWITEFGWDTLAGHIVSEDRQAAYLQRGFLLQLQAGIDKAFWYWNRDTREKPKQFFDGCGVFDGQDQPKPAAAAMAAMASFLKLPKPVGTFEPAPGAMGHVFRDGDRLVACAFKVEPDGPAIKTEFKDGKLFDMYGNPLGAHTVELGIAPVWITDLPQTDGLFLQTAYDIKSRRLATVTAGDTFTIELRVRGNRTAPIAAGFDIEAPKTWKVDCPSKTIAVAAGAEQVYPVKVTVDPSESAAQAVVSITVKEGTLQRTLPTRFIVLPAAQMTIEPLTGGPGESKVAAKVVNRSMRPETLTVTAVTPKAWRIDPAKLELKDIAAGKAMDLSFNVTWNLDWTSDEKAELIVTDAAGQKVAQCSIIPNALRLPKVEGIKFDGDLADWPAAAKLPAWVLGRLGAEAAGEAYMGYNAYGLVLAFKVDNSAASVTDPTAFWAQACIELCLDTANDKSPRKAYASTDHQFWFCPMVKEGRAYVGRWKRNSEIPETLFDIKGITSAVKKTETGYIMEVLLPAAQIKGFDATKGRKLGLNLNIGAPTKTGRSELYWPREKAGDTVSHPESWGIVELK